MSEPLLRIENHHAAACGDPPIVNSDDPDLYLGYFENAHGDQWIFSFHKKSHRAELRGGDIGWNDGIEIKNGELSAELVLSPSETQWLKACLATAKEFVG